MKNIQLIPTDKPSRLIHNDINQLCYQSNKSFKNDRKIRKKFNIYITSDEEIKEGDWIFNEEREPCIIRCIGKGSLRGWKKITLTTDQDLIKNGVQAIDDEFLEWFVKNPSCEEVEINRDWGYPSIIIPKEEPKQDLEKEMFDLEQELDIPSHLRWDNSKPKQETLEEAAEKEFPLIDTEWCRTGACEEENFQLLGHRRSFIKGAKWQQERSYSEEEVRLAIKKARDISDGKDCFDAEDISGCTEVCTYGWKFNMSEDSIIEQFKKK